MEVCICYFVVEWGIYCSYSDIIGGFGFNGDGLHGAGYRLGGVFYGNTLMCGYENATFMCFSVLGGSALSYYIVSLKSIGVCWSESGFGD